ncbi:hypothetical protein PHYBOEH_002177 [Phytophthora boehmeriae]|uniref:Uncharacterized protein n=1 Tax=Phytophthora boehmeriae TaxID=109152 RepID=A0A8T1WUY8_9STRA|nr:hypothetical protein PHYBOEH_002177 [Phytophthora boehmeriae]
MLASQLFATATLALTAFNVVAGQSTLPSMRIAFNVHRPSMAVFGSTSFDVYLKPVVSGSNVTFDGKMSIEQNGVTHSLVLADNVPYHEVVGNLTNSTMCVAPESIPSAVDIVDAIASATAVSTVKTDQDISCEGKWLRTTYLGTSFVLCASADVHDRNFTVYGEDFSAAFEYLSEEVCIDKPSSASDCTAVTTNSVPLSAVGQFYGKTVAGSKRALRDEVATAQLASPTCTCQGTPRPCLFLHGMDVTADGGIVDSYEFFGDIKKHAPCCSSFNYAVLNTVDYPWYDDMLQQKACDAAINITTGDASNGSTVINDLIVVAHSMGNSMFAGALATDKCSIGKNVDWVALSGPMKGSMGSDFMDTICGSGSDSSTLLSMFGGLIGQCPGTTTRRSLVYDGGDYCDAACRLRYAAARAMHAKYVTAGMCGTSYNGLLSREYAGLLAGGLLIPHHSSKNDGIVEFQSCVGNLDPSKFTDSYSNTWYAAKLNHADTTFHDGEGLFSRAQKPLKWFECLL